jgi:N-methylhydantoinase A/oxoprolinase/acetone carboxylase beta subunit
MRFAGQYHELRVDLPDDAASGNAVDRIEAAFLSGYTEVYGRAPSNLTPEVLNWHLTAELPRAAFQLAEAEQHERDHLQALKGERQVYFSEPERGYQATPVYDRYRLEPGAAMAGPAIIEEQEATIVVPPGCDVTIDGYRNVVISLNGKEQQA